MICAIMSQTIIDVCLFTGLLGFIFVKAWVALGTKIGLKMQPFTAQENTVIQTTCVSCYGLAWYGGFATYLFSMTPKIQQVLGDNPGM